MWRPADPWAPSPPSRRSPVKIRLKRAVANVAWQDATKTVCHAASALGPHFCCRSKNNIYRLNVLFLCVLGFLFPFYNLPLDILEHGRHYKESRFGLQRYQDVISSGVSGGRRLNVSERKSSWCHCRAKTTCFTAQTQPLSHSAHGFAGVTARKQHGESALPAVRGNIQQFICARVVLALIHSSS